MAIRVLHTKAWALLPVLLAACSNEPTGQGQVDAVEPAAANTEVRTELTIVGQGFGYGVVNNIDNGKSTLDDAYQAQLIGASGTSVSLEEVERLSDTTLRAFVPAGLAVGFYAIEVNGAMGKAEKADALKIFTDLDADNIHDDEDSCVDVDGDLIGQAAFDRSGCAADVEDSDDGDPSVCADTDSDTCEDCGSGSYKPFDDGLDEDADGFCAAADCDDTPLDGANCQATCSTFFVDVDGDGFGVSGASIVSCIGPPGYADNDTDCDDNPANCGANCFPFNLNADVCDGLDQDCDAQVDEDPATTWFRDLDSDGFGDSGGAMIACTQPLGFVANSSDCDDNPGACGAGCFPGNAAADICDSNNQDCDGSVDENPELTWFPDADGDGFGVSAGSSNACTQPGGFVANSNDCDDNPGACGAGCFPANPAADICDGDNQDCDGAVDEDPELTWFEDADGDGFGFASSSTQACVQPAGFVSDATDCADTPGSDPVCGGLDGNFCNPLVTEGPVLDATCTDTADNDCDGDTDGADSDCSCTEGQFQVTDGGTCYMMFTGLLEWQDARDQCLSIGAHLVAIETPAEQVIVGQLAANFPAGTPDVWIGANDLTVEGTFVWVNGSPFVFDNWRAGEPNNQGPEDCVLLEGDNPAREWDDRRCTTSLSSICER